MMKKQVYFSTAPVDSDEPNHSHALPSAPRYPEPQPLHRRSSLRSRRPPKGSFPSPLDHQPAPPVGAFPISLSPKDKKPLTSKLGGTLSLLSTPPSHSTRTAQYNKHGPSKMKKSIKKVITPLKNNGPSISSTAQNSDRTSTGNDGNTPKSQNPSFLFPSETYNSDKYNISSTQNDSSYFTTRTGASSSLSLRHRVGKSIASCLVLGRRNRKNCGNSTVHPNPTTIPVARSGADSTIGITRSLSTLEEDELPLMLEFRIDTTLAQQDHQYYDELRGVFNGKSLGQNEGDLKNINKENRANPKEEEDDDQCDIQSKQSTTGTTISGINSESPPSRSLRFEI